MMCYNMILFISMTIMAISPVTVYSRNIDASFRLHEKSPQYYDQRQQNPFLMRPDTWPAKPHLSYQRSSSSQRHHDDDQFSRRYALQNDLSSNDYEGMSMYGREQKDQLYNFGGWPNGFNNEDGWGSSPFFNTEVKDRETQSNTQKSFDDSSKHSLVDKSNQFGDLSQAFNSYDGVHQSNGPKDDLENGKVNKLPFIKKHYGDTIGLKKKHKYKENFHKSSKLTTNKINQAVKEFGKATVGEENKDEILHHTNQIVSDFERTKSKITNNLNPLVLAIGDATIGHENKHRIRHQLKQLNSTVPYLKDTITNFQTNSIHSKVKQKTKQTLEDLNYQVNLKAHQHIGKVKAKLPADLIARLGAKARKWARSLLGKYMPALRRENTSSASVPGAHTERQDVGTLGLLLTSATAMTVELIVLAIQGTPALFGLL